MLFPGWLRWNAPSHASRRRGRRSRPADDGKGRLRRLFRPAVEALEPRTLPAAILPGFDSMTLAANDDGSALADLGFTVNFLGDVRTQAYVNNNGNLTFGNSLRTFTPFGLIGTNQEIIAPFFADVDTRAGAVTQYGQGTVDGHQAFGVTWNGVDYYRTTDPAHDSKLNSFQVILINESDPADPSTQFGDF